MRTITENDAIRKMTYMYSVDKEKSLLVHFDWKMAEEDWVWRREVDVVHASDILNFLDEIDAHAYGYAFVDARDFDEREEVEFVYRVLDKYLLCRIFVIE